MALQPKPFQKLHIWQRIGALNRLSVVLHSLLPSCLDRFCHSKADHKGFDCPRLVSVQVDKLIASKIWIDNILGKRYKKFLESVTNLLSASMGIISIKNFSKKI